MARMFSLFRIPGWGCGHTAANYNGEGMMVNIFSLEGKTAVVLGGTSGIGRTLSLGLADAGAAVIASARRREHVDETAPKLERRGRPPLRLCWDVRHGASLEELLAACLKQF